MFSLIDRMRRLIDGGREFAMAVVVDVDGSSPKDIGSTMLVVPRFHETPTDPQKAQASTAPAAPQAHTPHGSPEVEVVGSISGGCIESAVITLGLDVLDSRQAIRQTFGISDEQVFTVGLTCGGIVHLLICPVFPGGPLAEMLTALADEEPGHRRIALVSDGDDRVLGLPTELSPGACEAEGLKLFTFAENPRPEMLIFGAESFAAALCAQASLLGHHVTVCDPRPAFATADRLPGADEIVVMWPTKYLGQAQISPETAICVLSHDSRFEIDLLRLALVSPARYVGAMGSRRTHERRVAALTELGVSAQRIKTLHSPIGLDLGATTPEETAVSIMAEVLATREGASARPLSATEGSIHRRSTDAVAEGDR